MTDSERCLTFTSFALSLPDWHQHSAYRLAVATAHAERLTRASHYLGFQPLWPSVDQFINDLTDQLPRNWSDAGPWHRIRIRLMTLNGTITPQTDIEPLAEGPDQPKGPCQVAGVVVARRMATIKHPDYSAENAELERLKPLGWDDLVRLSPQGHLLEGRVSAIVVIMPDGSYCSPDPNTHDCLSSLTLQHLMRSCPDRPWQLTTIHVHSLQQTPPAGAFLVNAVKGIMPIQRFSLNTVIPGVEWTFDVSQTQTAITRLAQALRPSGYHTGIGV